MRITIVGLLLALLACADREALKQEERHRRSTLAMALSGPPGANICQLNLLAAREGRMVSDATAAACREEMGQGTEKLWRAEQAYRKACEACATAEKCETELRRIRQIGLEAMHETACP